MRYRTAAILLILVLLPVPGYGSGQELPLIRAVGLPVLRVEIEGAQIPEGELEALVPFKAGSSLRPELIRESVLNFYRTGLYERVEVLLREAIGGIILKYHLVPKKWLDETDFSGNLYLDDQELRSRLDLRSRDEITAEKLEDNVQRLLDFYRYRGFVGTRVSYRIVETGQNRTKVTFEIDEGERQFISDVRMSGDPGMSRTRMLMLISSMPGTNLDGEKLDADVEKIRGYLRKQMYLTASLTYSVRSARDFPDSVHVNFDIRKGPVIRILISMDDVEESGKLAKRARSVFLKSPTPEKAKMAMERMIVDRYRGEGYPFTKVNIEDGSEGNGTRTITFEIDRGLRAVIGQLKVDGGRFFGSEPTLLLPDLAPGKPYIKDVMEQSIDDLAGRYRREGFLESRISRQPLAFIPGDDVQMVDISLEVSEGPRSMIRSLRMTGSPIPEARSLEILGVSRGDPYVPEILDSGREALLQELSRQGYLYGAVSVQEPEISPEHMVDIVVKVEAGPQVRLGSTIVTGNETVDTRIIRRALDLNRGEILTRDKITQAQNRIYDLKVMNSVDIQLADPEVPGAHKDLVVRVQERPKYVIGMRLGFGSEDKFRGEFSVTNRNFRQMARSVSLTARGSEIKRFVKIKYSHPWFQFLPIDMTLSFTDLYEERDSYTRDSLSLAVDFVRPLTDKTKVRVGYFFEGLELSDVSPDAHLSREEEGKTDIGAIVGEIILDTRNDFLDPWTGVLGDLILEYAAKPVGSKAEYYKAELVTHRYLNPFDNIVIAGLLRLGRADAYGDSDDVVISKRFFLGGTNSVRGYALDSLGPRDSEGDPVGGNFMVNANAELRYPIYGSLRGVLFVDSGSVWRENAPDPKDEEFHLRASSGAGLRWSSPIGPLSLDFGYKLNPVKEDENDRSRWHFNIGHAF